MAVGRLFATEFSNGFFNLSTAELYANYLMNYGAGRPDGTSAEFVICAPDDGASPFVHQVHAAFQEASARMLLKSCPSMLLMTKVRSGERQKEREMSGQDEDGA